MTDLRPYQNEAVSAVLQEWHDGHRKTLLNMATGTGKTIVFSSVLKKKLKDGEHALVLAHRSELLQQAQNKLLSCCELSSSLEKADSHAVDSFFPIVVGSVQTLSNTLRLQQYPRDYFSTIVVDEAHHTASQSYMRILDYFDNPDVLGVSATIDRTDKKSLGRYYDSIAYEYPMSKAILDGYLCPVKAQMIPLKLDISKVGVSNGDYVPGELGNAIEPYLERIALEMKKYCSTRKTVVFLPLVSISKKFCGILRKLGFNAAEVNGQSEDREELLGDFESGKYDVLCNSMLLTEGWDCPSVDCIVCLRPTKSRSLYTQIIGRGTRLALGKKDLLVLDFLWLSEKHDLCRPSVLVSPNEEISEKIDSSVESGECVDILDAEKKAERDIIAEREAKLAERLREMRNREKKLVDPLQFALSLEDEVLLNYTPSFMWEMEPPTEKQIVYLKNSGISADLIRNKGQAHMIIDRIRRRFEMGLSTPKQIRCLEKYGFVHVGTWPLKEAAYVLSMLSRNGWRVPLAINPATYKPGRLAV